MKLVLDFALVRKGRPKTHIVTAWSFFPKSQHHINYLAFNDVLLKTSTKFMHVQKSHLKKARL